VQLNADEAGEVVFKVMGLHRKAELCTLCTKGTSVAVY
jgi:hypothetical protein